MQPRNEKFCILFSKAGSNVVESAGILTEFVAAQHERWAELAKPGVRADAGERSEAASDLAGLMQMRR
jgi:hypothetical protein